MHLGVKLLFLELGNEFTLFPWPEHSLELALLLLLFSIRVWHYSKSDHQPLDLNIQPIICLVGLSNSLFLHFFFIMSHRNISCREMRGGILVLQ